MLAFIDKPIERIEKEITGIVQRNELLNSQVKLLARIDDFDDKTTWAILAYIDDISLFDNSKQISSYAEPNPSIEQFRSSIKRSSLSTMGCARLRK